MHKKPNIYTCHLYILTGKKFFEKKIPSKYTNNMCIYSVFDEDYESAIFFVKKCT